MPKIAYIDKKISNNTRSTIETANDIIDEYQAQGYSLTLRQLYYQFVSRDLIPNTEREYKKLGTAINTGRLIGMIDWSSIEDRTRFLRSVSTWDSPAQIVRSCAAQFKVDLWETQPRRVEVWIEKDALLGVIEEVCNKWQVPHFSCRGYPSQSEVWSASQRLGSYADDQGQEPLILHLGDHDPSGIDMTRDIIDRTELFTGRSIEVNRLALNMDQVEQYNPPPNPAKLTDSRCQNYIANFGASSWELDALEPSVLADLVEENIKAVIDFSLWEVREDLEVKHRESLNYVADNMVDEEE